MSENQEIKDPLDTGHDYDGIREHDNRLPNWWVAVLLLTMLFGYGYWMYYHVLRTDSAQLTEYGREMDEAAAIAMARARERGAPTDESLTKAASSPSIVDKGATAFKQSCAACHGAQGQGLIGANLTDNYWLHGAKPTEILKTVSDGVAAKGMPAWGPALGAEGVEAVVAYLWTLKGTNVPGKEPQGELASNSPNTAAAQAAQ